MWLLYLVSLFCLYSFSASLVEDCLLKEKWILSRPPLETLNLDEIYRPIDQWDIHISYQVYFDTVIRPPYIEISRSTNNGTCSTLEVMNWNLEDMFLKSNQLGCSDWDWPTVLVYFNDDLTLGVLTECSRSKKIRHVLSDQGARKNITPPMQEVQDLIMRYEKEVVDLSYGTTEANIQFDWDVKSCNCSTKYYSYSPPPKEIGPIGWYTFGLFSAVVFICIIISMCFVK